MIVGCQTPSRMRCTHSSAWPEQVLEFLKEYCLFGYCAEGTTSSVLLSKSNCSAWSLNELPFSLYQLSCLGIWLIHSTWEPESELVLMQRG